MSVYFAQRGNGPIKIGHSRSVKVRMSGLGAGVKLLGAIPGGRSEERAMHVQFAHLRLNPKGEWFAPADDLIEYIRTHGQDHTPDSELGVATAVRYSKSFVKELDRIAERISEPGKRFTRVEVLRMASYRGLEQLEAEKRKR
jgi:hypothetical protein